MKTAGQIAYEAFIKKAKAVDVNNADQFNWTWDMLQFRAQRLWEGVAQAVIKFHETGTE